MLTKESLRFIDDNTFQEAVLPEDRSRPLEWRRSFNTISFEIYGPNVEVAYTINEVDHFSCIRQEPDQESRTVITAAVKRRLRVSSELQQDTIRDRIFQTKETEKGSGIYQLQRTKDPVRISFLETNPTEPRGPYAQGAYPGVALKADFEHGEDNLYIEVGVPFSQLEEIAAELKSGRANAIHVSISIQCFSNEVDDTLNEWYHVKDLFIHSSATQAVLLSLNLMQKESKKEPVVEVPDEAGDEPVAPTPPPMPMPMPDYTAALGGIKIALWMIVAILTLQLLK